MKSINQKLFLINFIIILLVLVCFRILFDIDHLLPSGQEYYNVAFTEFKYKFFGAISFVILIVILLQVYLNMSISSPLKKLKIRMNDIASTGNYEPIKITNQDEIGQLARSFNSLIKQIKSRITEQEQLSDNICHEIKTPLTAIMSSADILSKDDKIPKEQAKSFINTIHTESKKLILLTENISNYSQIKGKVSILDKKQVALFKNIEELLGASYSTQNIQINASLEDKEHLVKIDTPVFNLAIKNILDNSLKYSPLDSPIVISLKSFHSKYDSKNDHFILSISNSSPHIPNAFQDKIFERLFSLKVSDAPKGSGIGLALAKDIIEMHNGQILTENLAPLGVVFSITLPMVYG